MSDRKIKRNVPVKKKSKVKKERVHVVVRIKPLGAGGGGGEIEAKNKDCKSSMTFSEKKIQCGERNYDYAKVVIPPSCGQQKTYDSVMGDLTSKFLGGVNVNVLGYGQTGSGKTHTLYGPPNLISKYYELKKKITSNSTKTTTRTTDEEYKEEEVEGEEEESENIKSSPQKLLLSPYEERLLQYEKDLGIFPRAAFDILKIVKERRSKGLKCSLSATMVEIHLMQTFDVLNNKNPIGFERNDCMFRGEVEWPIETEKDMLKLCAMSEKRATGATLMNDTSSRSHLVVCLYYCQKSEESGKVRTSKFNVIDLGGSERAHEAHGIKADPKKGLSAFEGLAINLTLFILLWCVETFSRRKRTIMKMKREKRIKEFTRGLSTYWFGVQLPCLIHGSFVGTACTRIFINVSQAPRNTFQSNYALEFGRKASFLDMIPMKNRLYDHEKLMAMTRRKLKEHQSALKRLQDNSSRSQKYVVKRKNEIRLLQNKLKRLIRVK